MADQDPQPTKLDDPDEPGISETERNDRLDRQREAATPGQDDDGNTSSS